MAFEEIRRKISTFNGGGISYSRESFHFSRGLLEYIDMPDAKYVVFAYDKEQGLVAFRFSVIASPNSYSLHQPRNEKTMSASSVNTTNQLRKCGYPERTSLQVKLDKGWYVIYRPTTNGFYSE